MRNTIEFAAEILENNIDGFHRYCFAAPAHPDYVSRNLCEMIGCTPDELLDPSTDAYAALIYQEDRADYRAFLNALSMQEQRLTLQYRILCKNGSVKHVQDTMVSRRDANGVMQGFSTLTDVTAIKKENEALHALNETVPCGIVKYTCTEIPRVTYLNEQMLRILRFPMHDPRSQTLLEQYKQNIMMLVAPEERERFSRFLQLVYSQDRPIAGETTFLRCDGTRVRLYGWISKTVNSDGAEEFQSVCMDATERYDRKRKLEIQQYLRALTQVYDDIIELDFPNKAVRFLHGHYRDRLGTMSKLTMRLEDVEAFWLNDAVLEEDRAKVRAVFEELEQRDLSSPEGRPPQIEFRARFSDQSVRSYMGIFLRTAGTSYLLCCRNITHQKEADRLKIENSTLRDITEQMQELVMQFSDGMLAFEISGDRVRPLYYSENICRFFGYTKEEWLGIMRTLTPIPDFVSKCHIPYDTFLELLEGNEAEFQFADHRYKAIRTARVGDQRESYYVMLYDVTKEQGAADSPDGSPAPAMPEVYIRTFGYFDVFVNGTPIAFRNEKAKELCALLVDRRGGFITSNEAIAHLWEDEPANSVTLARYRKVALRLKNTLEEYGIADIVESVDGKRRIVTQLLKCDLFDYLSGDPQYAQLFKGSYLQNYSWGERTLAELSD